MLERQETTAAQSAYQTQLAHLIKLARTPGWKEYTWHRAKELDADASGLHRGIAADLVAAMKQRQAGKV